MQVASTRTSHTTHTPISKSPLLSKAPTPVVGDRREVMIDIFRGLAVLLMMITHSISFFHVGSDQLVTTIGTYGGIASFTLFLFIAGVSAYFSFVKYPSHGYEQQLSIKRRQIVWRTITILFAYYAIAFVASIPQFHFPPSLDWISIAIQIFTLTTVAPFAEFILAFVLFNLILIVSRRLLYWLAQFPLLGFVLAGGLYFTGYIISQMTFSPVLDGIKSLIFGHQDLHRFPITHYFIVYFLGLLWGKFLLSKDNIKIRIRTTLFAVIASGLALFAGYISFQVLQFDFIDPLHRWPPAITFLLIGIFSVYVIIYALYLTNNLRFTGGLQALINYIGTKAFSFFVFHTIILYAYQYLTGDQRQSSPILIGIYYVLLVIGTFLITVGFDATVRDLKASSNSKSEFGWVLSDKIIVSLVTIGVVIIVGMSLFQQQVSATGIKPDEVKFQKRLVREENWPFWWNYNYQFFRQLVIDNSNSLSSVFTDEWIEIGFNHAALVGTSKSLGNGADVRVVYYSEKDDAFYEVPFVFNGINTPNSNVQFQLEDNVNVGEKNDKYFLYYGYPYSNAYPASQGKPTRLASTSLTLGDEQKLLLSGQTNRKWLLRESSLALKSRTLLYTVNVDASLSPESVVVYRVLGTALTGRMDKISNGQYQAAIDVSKLDPNVYQIQASASEPQARLKSYSSGYSTFFVSYPMYVVWTQDWEGTDVPDFKLNGLDAMANKYGIPMTHFFNPRIYVTSTVTKQRADQLTLWVQNRSKNHGDDIGLHFHMWYDMVRAAGVRTRSAPYSGWLYGDGGGVKVSAYTTEEMVTLLNWARRTFQDNGLPVPVTFRAGGWYLETAGYQALEETGFLVDSSGRTTPADAADKRQLNDPPPWHLSPTQRPYLPSRTDLNSSAGPTFNVWQFPNNGADSYWYNEATLISRFNQNYPNKGDIIRDPQVLVYLSHPPFFQIDQPKMTKVFDYIGQFLYKNDAGPVMYTTLENAYYSWDKN